MKPTFSIRRSLILRMFLAMAAISSLALIGLLGSIVIAKSAGGYADAINQAGSLRMQAYRLMSTSERVSAHHPRMSWQIEHLQATLVAPSIVGLIPEKSEGALGQAYDSVLESWRNELLPALEDDVSSNNQAMNEIVEDFVSRVDVFVGNLQKNAEKKVVLLEVFQGASVTILVSIMVMVAYHIICGVMPPFRELVGVVNGVMVGDFSGRTTYRGNDELGLLSRTINKMNASLSEMYGQLEKRVAAKTHELKRSNEALRMLYLTARRLNGINPLTQDELIDVLHQLESVTDEGPFELCLSLGAGQDDVVLLSSRCHGTQRRQGAMVPEDSWNTTSACSDATFSEEGGNAYAVRVREAGRDYGELRVIQPPGHMLAQWKIELIETVAGLIAATLSLSEKANEQRRLALMDERAVIARELHDSLAQSLSYLKIQVTRLQMQFDRQRYDDVAQVVAELRHGLNSSYRQLRELLNTFRLRINEAGLEAALNEAVEEFAKRGELQISVRGQWGRLPLSPNEEIHVLQIVREALSNVVRHAKANACEISLSIDDDQVHVLSIRDDGVGIGAESESDISHGMAIMEERARSLNGSLEIRSASPSGIVVSVRFLPSALKRLPAVVG